MSLAALSTVVVALSNVLPASLPPLDKVSLVNLEPFFSCFSTFLVPRAMVLPALETALNAISEKMKKLNKKGYRYLVLALKDTPFAIITRKDIQGNVFKAIQADEGDHVSAMKACLDPSVAIKSPSIERRLVTAATLMSALGLVVNGGLLPSDVGVDADFLIAAGGAKVETEKSFGRLRKLLRRYETQKRRIVSRGWE